MAHGFTDDKEITDLDTFVNEKINNLTNQVTTLENKLTNYWKTIYPVGAIYMSTAQTNPATLFGGTWVAWGSGRVPVGVNVADSDFNTVEKTGGEKKHKLTIAEMPAHSHQARVMADNDPSPSYSETNYFKAGADSQEGGTYTETTGGGQSHNNLQPYITCYMYKRTA